MVEQGSQTPTRASVSTSVKGADSAISVRSILLSCKDKGVGVSLILDQPLSWLPVERGRSPVFLEQGERVCAGESERERATVGTGGKK